MPYCPGNFPRKTLELLCILESPNPSWSSFTLTVNKCHRCFPLRLCLFTTDRSRSTSQSAMKMRWVSHCVDYGVGQFLSLYKSCIRKIGQVTQSCFWGESDTTLLLLQQTSWALCLPQFVSPQKFSTETKHVRHAKLCGFSSDPKQIRWAFYGNSTLEETNSVKRVKLSFTETDWL